MASFKELQDIGSKIREIYLKDPNEEGWFSSIAESCGDDEFPPDTFSRIVDYLQLRKDKESDKLAELILQISQDEDINNILYPIFAPEDEIPEEENPADDNNLKIPDDFDEEECENQDLSIPQNYFDHLIEGLQMTLGISYDLSYLLLKKYGWDTNEVGTKWINSQDKTLSVLKIKFDKTLFPSTKDPILAQPCGQGTCPLCFSDTDLYQLYCGHQYCQDCLLGEIIFHIKNGDVPICRATDKKGTMCKSEIIPSDVEQFVEDSDILDMYYKIWLDSEINSCPGVRECPNCHILITSANEIGCHTGQCPHCNYATCLKCLYPGSHAPLINCDHINDFTITVKNKMAMLDQAQKLWYIREERLKKYRSSHQGDPSRYFDGLISDTRQNLKKISDKEASKIKEMNAINSEREKKLNELMKKRTTIPDPSLESQITDLQKQISSTSALRSLYEKEHRINGQDRDRYMKRTEKLKTLYFWSVTEVRHKYQYGIVKFKNKINRLVSQKLSKPIDLSAGDDANSETSSKVTKKCPKCHVTIYKQGGCNYVQCLNCHYEFCWICNQPWVSPHGDHFFCPNYSLSKGLSDVHVINGIDYNDPKDEKFYPMPLDPEKLTEFVKYNNLYMEYTKNMDKYEELTKEFLKDNDKKYMRFRLKKCLQKENSEEEAEKITNRIFNCILLAQSVIAWGYCELFYIQKEIAYNLFEYKIFQLEKIVDGILKLLSSYDLSQSTTYFQQEEDIIKSEINNILVSAEAI